VFLRRGGYDRCVAVGHGLQRGASIVIPNLTTFRIRTLQEIYLGKACVNESVDAVATGMLVAGKGRHGRSAKRRWLGA
jgi:hypothetical protein